MLLRMDLTALLSTALGAFIAVGSTYVAERSRSRREARQRRHDNLQSLYADFLEATSQARAQIWRAAFEELGPRDERMRSAQTALDAAVFPTRNRISLSAPRNVIQPAHDLVASLVVYRNVILGGARSDDESSDAARLAFIERRDELIDEMRKTLPQPN